MLMDKPITMKITPARKHLRLASLCMLVLSALVLLAACGGSSTGTGSGTPATTPAATSTQANNAPVVMITTDSSGTFTFSPATITIKAGTTVTWKNGTSVAHTVTSDDGGKAFDSGTSNPVTAQTGTFTFTFKTPGTFAYHCSFHPFMKGTVIVQ